MGNEQTVIDSGPGSLVRIMDFTKRAKESGLLLSRHKWEKVAIMRSGKRAPMVGALALVVSTVFVVGVATPVRATAASIVVDAATDLGGFNNPALYHNQVASLPTEDLARVNDVGPARVVRVWAKPANYYDEATGEYNFSRAYGYFDSAAAHADQLLFNFDQCDQALMNLSAPQTCRDVLKAGIRHYKLRYPTMRYIEVFNEPDKTWTPGPLELPAIPLDDYYRWYKIAYSVVNEVNQELNPDLRIQIGGPATYHLNTAYISGFLDRFAFDPDPAKKLDFISYHEYGRRSDPANVRLAKSTIQGWLSDRGLDRNTPVVVSEYGVFPGAADGEYGHGPGTEAEDMLTQAAAMATLGIFYINGGTDMPLHWTFNHPTNERKSMFVDGVPGAVRPYYNVVKMQRMLKERRISATSTALDAAGIGVNALATRDNSGIAVLATNYQWTTGTTQYDVALDVRNLPGEFTGHVLIERYLVDAVTSNYSYDPANAQLRQVERRVVPAGGSVNASFTLTRNAITLVVLTPVVQVEAEDLATAYSGGDNAIDISDTAASGGRLNKFVGSGVGDFVRYTVTVPRAGRYRITARMKETPERAIAQLSIDGVDQGAPIDTYWTGYRFRDIDLGVATFAAAGAKAFTFTLIGTSGGAWTLGVDQITLQPLYGVRVQAESTTPRISAGDHVYALTDPAASGGGLVKLAADAPGDWIRLSIHVPKAGTYRLSLAMKTFPNRGRCQVNVNGTAVGTPVDSYAAVAGFVTLPAGMVTLDRSGAATIGCEVTGANPASTGYEVAIDTIQLEEA
jgi:hypothetical protein